MSQNETFLQSLRVGIVGGGPGGLTLARLLQMRGAQVTVFEQEPSSASRPQGSSLDLKPESGRAAVKAAGLESEFLKVARFGGDRHLIMDQQARILLDLPEIHFLPAAPEIDRPELRDMFLQSFKVDTVKWGYSFLRLEEKQSEVIVHFENGELFSFDLVIGSDGAGSKVRPYVTPIQRQYSGVSWIEGSIQNPEASWPEIFKIVDHGNAFALGEEKGLLFQEKGDGSMTFYFTAKVPEDQIRSLTEIMKNPKSAREYLQSWLHNWCPQFLRVLEASTGSYIVRPINGTPEDQSWNPRKRITLIGDAAHLMPPFAGEGANSAMFDAVVLATALDQAQGFDSAQKIMTAIAGYEKEMFLRTGRSKRQTAVNEKIFHEPDAAKKLVREILGVFAPFAALVPAIIHTLNWLASPFVQRK